MTKEPTPPPKGPKPPPPPPPPPKRYPTQKIIVQLDSNVEQRIESLRKRISELEDRKNSLFRQRNELFTRVSELEALLVRAYRSGHRDGCMDDIKNYLEDNGMENEP